MSLLLPTLKSPADLHCLTDAQLLQLAEEMRHELCQPLLLRSTHFASNLGVVELCLALHLTFDFRHDRLIWDTGHQIYPHKLLTGRYASFRQIRSKGGLMGYPNPLESDYDLFMTGHAGSSVSTALGLKVGDDLMGRPDRKSVVVLGDGALPSGIVFEAMNNASGVDKDLLVILNDNGMSICERVGGLAKALDKARLSPGLNEFKRTVEDWMARVPFVGSSMEKMWTTFKDYIKSNFYGGMLFEGLGFHYIGPIDGHDLPQLREYLSAVKQHRGPVLLHVITEKGRGFSASQADPVTFHAPPVFERIENGDIVLKKSAGAKAFTDVVSQAIHQGLATDPKVCVITAAMCQGNKLNKVREEFPDRFFDTGICESHAVAFAAGLAKVGMRPIVDIYSTFLQRAFDQVFQEVALQNLPVVFCMDRAGFTGPDGPTHHGTFDIPYLRLFPNLVVMAPGDELDVGPMLEFALTAGQPTSLRYPKAVPGRVERDVVPVELGQAEIFDWGVDGCIIAFGSLFADAVQASAKLRALGFDIGVINARFAKPLDTATIFKAIEELPLVMTLEEGTILGGFGSAVLEAANQAKLRTDHVLVKGIPDHFIMHAERHEQLAEVGLDVAGIVGTLRPLLLARRGAAVSVLESARRPRR